MNKINQIIWNGVDGYVHTDTTHMRDLNTTWHSDGSVSVFTQREEFKSFLAIEVNKADIPLDEDGEMVLNDLYVTDDFRVWKAVK